MRRYQRTPMPVNMMFDLLNKSMSNHKIVHRDLQANVIKGDEGYVVEFAAPGFDKSDFDIKLEEQYVTVSVKTDAVQKYVNQEFAYTDASKRVALPKDIDRQAISAKYELGVLKLYMPRVQPEQPKTLSISID